jgi:2-polyprenyl-6-methoxyphenol hydroxylase-like FAD-dependent oxidoreductase
VIDLLVAGGGPVGLAVAIRGRLAGLEVTVVEPRSTPVDKACGEGLMPSAVRGLHDIGVEVDGHPFAGIRYVGGRRHVEARFVGGPGLGVRRTTLHAALAARADDVGVVRKTGRVDQVSQHPDHVEAAGVSARWLIAADGLHSPVRRAIGLDRSSRGPARYGLRRHFEIAPWTDLVEVHWSEHAEAYVTPVGADLVGVALLCGAEGHRRGYAETLADFPDLCARLGGAAPVTPVAMSTRSPVRAWPPGSPQRRLRWARCWKDGPRRTTPGGVPPRGAIAGSPCRWSPRPTSRRCAGPSCQRRCDCPGCSPGWSTPSDERALA